MRGEREKKWKRRRWKKKDRRKRHWGERRRSWRGRKVEEGGVRIRSGFSVGMHDSGMHLDLRAKDICCEMEKLL